MAGGFQRSSESDIGPDSNMHRTVYSLIFKHEPAETAGRIEAYPQFCNIIDAGSFLSLQVVTQHLRLTTSLNRGNKPILHMTYDRFFQQADANIRNAGIRHNDPICRSLQWKMCIRDRPYSLRV